MADYSPAGASEQQRFDNLLIERSGAVMIVTLNRPERHNAVGGDMHDALETVLAELRTDASVRAVLLRGAGRSFCTGGDVKSFGEAPVVPQGAVQRMQQITASGANLVRAFLSVPQPVVAAVQGYALGLGATLALMCDVVIAAEDAQIADTHVPVGLVAGDGGALAWPLAMNMGAAKYYLMTGERISGAEAARLGLVFKAVPAAELQERALEVANRLAALPPLAVQGTKATVNRILQQRSDLVMEHGLMLEGMTFLSGDHQEAVSAFAQKRPGIYQGA